MPSLVVNRVSTFCLIGLLPLSGCLSPRTALPTLAPEAIAEERQIQREAFLASDEYRRARLNNVAFPLLRTAAELFPGQARPAIGIVTLTVDDLNETYRESAIRLYGLSALPQVRGIAAGSPAEAAGIQLGDRITHVDGEPLDDAPTPTIEVLRRALEIDRAVTLRVTRGEDIHDLVLTPEPLAPYRQQLVHSQEINALATGGAIRINLGLMDFCENDTELAFVFAHELAHNALRHHRDFVFNYLMGTAADLALLALRVPSANVLGLVSLRRPSSDYEREADYVALYLLARAGYDLEELQSFWRRMALLGPERRTSRHTLWTHPETAERQILLQHAIQEIQQRLKEGVPLEPLRRG